MDSLIDKGRDTWTGNGNKPETDNVHSCTGNLHFAVIVQRPNAAALPMTVDYTLHMLPAFEQTHKGGYVV